MRKDAQAAKTEKSGAAAEGIAGCVETVAPAAEEIAGCTETVALEIVITPRTPWQELMEAFHANVTAMENLAVKDM